MILTRIAKVPVYDDKKHGYPHLVLMKSNSI
uniref:Uncharacterized protein n=1 Tax=Arundo donax TaxID=35708 RepID=A0A0A8ZHK5_ARUDO